jgi:hypothetical protein
VGVHAERVAAQATSTTRGRATSSSTCRGITASGARDPLDREIRYEYTPSEQIAAVVDPAGNRHEYRYDLRDAADRGAPQRVAGRELSARPRRKLTAKRDARGELLVEYEYGAENLKSRRVLADGEEHHYEYAPNGRFARVNYGGMCWSSPTRRTGRRCRDLRDGRGVEHVFEGGRAAETRALGRFVTRYRRLDEKTLEIEDPLGNKHAIVLEPEGAVVRRMACGAHEVVQFDSLGRCSGSTCSPRTRRRRCGGGASSTRPRATCCAVEDSERARRSTGTTRRTSSPRWIAPDGRGSGVSL